MKSKKIKKSLNYNVGLLDAQDANTKSAKHLDITKNDTIEEAIKKNPVAKEILFKEGLICAECPAASLETIEEGCLLHGIDVNKIIKRINQN